MECCERSTTKSTVTALSPRSRVMVGWIESLHPKPGVSGSSPGYGTVGSTPLTPPTHPGLMRQWISRDPDAGSRNKWE